MQISVLWLYFANIMSVFDNGKNKGEMEMQGILGHKKIRVFGQNWEFVSSQKWKLMRSRQKSSEQSRNWMNGIISEKLTVRNSHFEFASSRNSNNFAIAEKLTERIIPLCSGSRIRNDAGARMRLLRGSRTRKKGCIKFYKGLHKNPLKGCIKIPLSAAPEERAKHGNPNTRRRVLGWSDEL